MNHSNCALKRRKSGLRTAVQVHRGGCVKQRQAPLDLVQRKLWGLDSKVLGAWIESLGGLIRVTFITRVPFQITPPLSDHAPLQGAPSQLAQHKLSRRSPVYIRRTIQIDPRPLNPKLFQIPTPHSTQKLKKKEQKEKKKKQWLPLPTFLSSWMTVARRLVVEITTALSAVSPLLVLLQVCQSHSFSHNIVQSTHTFFHPIFSLNTWPHPPCDWRFLVTPPLIFPPAIGWVWINASSLTVKLSWLWILSLIAVSGSSSEDFLNIIYWVSITRDHQSR